MTGLKIIFSRRIYTLLIASSITTMNPVNSYQPSSPRPAKHRRFRTLFRFVLVAGVVVAGIAAAPHLFYPKKGSAQVASRTPAEQQQAIAAMGSQINSVLSQNQGVDISVTVTNLKNGQSQSYGPVVPYEAASVAKLITATDFLHQVENGQESLNEHLEDGNTASYDLRQMIVMSDNNAWQSLNDELTLTNLGQYASSIGIADYNLSDNTLETNDIALLLQKLYGNKLLGKSDTNLLLGYMKIANEAGFIVPAVPKGVTVYHKAGVLDDRIHDAAIIADPNNPVALVIFTNGHGAGDDSARTAAIQSITKDVLTAYDIK
jgi:beta-lactamase class A